MLKVLYNTINRRKNKELVNVIKSGLSDLKGKNNEMSDDETKIEKSYKIVRIVEEIIEFNRQNQEGQGLKILTPDQILSRLPITLAQQKSLKLKITFEITIRQLSYSLYRFKKLTKTIYNNLINTI